MSNNKSINTILKSFGYATIVIALPALCGCSIFSNNSQKYVVSGSSAEASGTMQTETSGQTLTPPTGKQKPIKVVKPSDGKPVKNNKNNKVEKNQDSSQSDVADTKRDAVESEATTKSPVIDATATIHFVDSTGMAINGEWTIYSVRGNIITGEERPYINFDLAANRMYGNNGCNVLNATLKLTPPSSLQFEDFITTMRMCVDAQYEYLINLALADVRGYQLRNVGPDTYLDLTDEKGTTLVTLRRHNMEFLNGPWSIVTLNDTAMPKEGEDKAASIVIDIPQLRVHGNTGCNVFNGSLFIDPDKKRSMQFSHMAITRMYCGPDSRETELLVALEAAESAKQIDADTVELYDASGKPLMTLKKIVYPNE